MSGRMALCKRSGMSPSGTSGRCRWHSLAQGFYSAACQSPDRVARCQSFIRCQSQSAAERDGSFPPWHQDWRKQCVEQRKKWKQSWGCEAPNRCIPWGDNGAKSHLARKHMQDLRREAGAEVCLPRPELREWQGNPFRNFKVEVATLRTQRPTPQP